MKHLRTPFMEYNVFSSTLENLPVKNPLVINTINQYSFCIAEEDKRFKEALQNSDVLLPDGIGVVAAVRLLSGGKIKKIAGADLFYHLMNELQRSGGSCFFLGSSESTLTKIKERVADDFPSVNAGFYSPPYRPVFSQSETRQMIDTVNKAKPDVLFIGMTAPKQEKWANDYKDQLDAKIICSIGAVFDFYAGTVERPHPFWISIGLEWFVRFCKEPKRMWKRYFYYGPVFLFHVFKGRIRPRSSSHDSPFK